MSEQMDSWHNLICPGCEGAEFTRVFAIRRNSLGGGVVEKPVGWRCVGCEQMADVQAMIRASGLQAKREELKRLEQELSQNQPTMPSRRSSTA